MTGFEAPLQRRAAANTERIEDLAGRAQCDESRGSLNEKSERKMEGKAWG